MSRKSLLVLLVLAVVIGLAAWLTRQSSKPDETAAGALAPGQKLLAGLDPSQIAGVKVHTPDGAVTLKKGENDIWSVAERDGFTADAERLSGLIKGMLDLKITQAQQAGPSQYARLQLALPDAADEKLTKEQKGTVVRLLDAKDAVLAEVVFGKAPQSEGQDPMAAMSGGGVGGKFVRLAKDTTQVFLVSESVYQATGKPADWIEKTFFQPGALKRIAVTGDEGFQGWEVIREKPDASFTLKDVPAGKQLAAATGSALTSFLGYAQATDILTKTEVEALDSKQSRVATLETFDGLTYKLTLTPLATQEGDTGGANYAVQAEIAGTYVEPTPADGAKKPEEMSEEEKKADAANKEAAKKAWDEKLAKEQKLAARVFKVGSYTVDAIWKSGSEVVEDIPAPPPAPEGTPPELLTPPPGMPVPSPTGATAPATATSPPISVTTPPIEVPAAAPTEAAPVEEKPADKPKEDNKTPEPAKPAEAPKAPEPAENIDATEPLPSR